MNKYFRMNLQLFSGEKTEKATLKRREDARKKGQVAKSNEITTVLVLTIGMLVLQFWVPKMQAEFQRFCIYAYAYTKLELTAANTRMLIIQTLIATTRMAGPVLFAALAAGYLANVVQIGFLFTTEPLKFDLKRLNPVNGFQRIFSKRAIAELMKALLKIFLVGFIALMLLKKQLPGFTVLMYNPVNTSLEFLGSSIYTVCWRVIAILFVLAVFDYVYQHYEYEQSLKMTKQEIKEEYKSNEGDPLLKAKIKEKQRQWATRRMMQEVPKATVVVTNPTHLAVALKYDSDMGAPQIIAKGQDHIAFKIKEVAAANSVVIVENKTLARVLYQRVEIGMYIPADLYQAVAEVIAYAYKLKKRK